MESGCHLSPDLGNLATWCYCTLVVWFKRSLLKKKKKKALMTTILPYKCSWVARKILNCRTAALWFIKYYVGVNSNFIFCHDPWVNGKIIWNISLTVISIAEFIRLVPINVYLRDSTWNFPISNNVDVIEVRRLVASVHVYNTDCIT